LNNKLFIGNLPYSATEDELKEAFAQAGEVQTVKIVTDRQSGRSKGFGFIEMASEEAAKAAIEKLNGAEYAGRTISVSEARPPEERPAREGRPGGGFGGGRGPRRDGAGGGGRGPRRDG
jgi:cold-inducible RNA-binding protein